MIYYERWLIYLGFLGADFQWFPANFISLCFVPHIYDYIHNYTYKYVQIYIYIYITNYMYVSSQTYIYICEYIYRLPISLWYAHFGTVPGTPQRHLRAAHMMCRPLAVRRSRGPNRFSSSTMRRSSCINQWAQWDVYIINMYIYIYKHLFIYLFNHLSNYWSNYLIIHLSIYLFIHLYMYCICMMCLYA